MNAIAKTSCLPSKKQELLLKAAILKGSAAINSWSEWSSSSDLAAVDHETQLFLPVVYSNLYGQGFRDPGLERCRGLYRKSWAKNKVLLHEMTGILRMVQDAGVTVLVLKGAAMSLLYYKEQGIRPMEDIDILVPPEHAKNAIDALFASGWTRTKNSGTPFNERFPDVNKANHFEKHGCYVDMHWHLLLASSYQGGDDDFRAGAVPVRIDDTLTVQALNPTDHIFHLLVHAMRWNPAPLLRWVADAMTILDSGQEIDWNRLLKQAENRELLLPVRNGLFYLHELMNAPIPPAVLEEIRKKEISSFEYREFRVHSHPEKLLAGLLHTWYQHCRVHRKESLLRRLASFPRHLQITLGARHLWQFPFYFILFGVRRVWTFFFNPPHPQPP